MNTLPHAVRCASLSLVCLGTCGAAIAVEPLDAAGAGLHLPRTEFTAESVPRWDGGEAQSGQRVEAVRWAGRDGHAVGLAVGVAFEPLASAQGAIPHAGLGLRWRSPLGPNRRLDIATWRSASPLPATARIELQFVPAQDSRAWVAEFGAIGVQLSGDSKLTLRVRGGKPMVYYRSRF